MLSKLKQKISTLDNRLKRAESLTSTSPARKTPQRTTPTTAGTKASPTHSDGATPIPTRGLIRDASLLSGEADEEKKGEEHRSDPKADGAMSSKGVKKIRVVKKAAASISLFSNV